MMACWRGLPFLIAAIGFGCGSRALDPGEMAGTGGVSVTTGCDGGNTTAGDGCSDSCVVEPTAARCGDGIVEGAEECDEGSGDTTYGSGCTAACRFAAFCGDGVVNGPEACDLGLARNNTVYGNRDGCTPSCTLPHYCGDGIVDVNDGEQCDFGANNGQV